MPYCCQCGVELDIEVKKCPLCHYPMPDFKNNQDNLVKSEKNDKLAYPAAENIYHEIVFARKSKALFVLATIQITAIIAFAVLRFQYPTKIFDYLAISFGAIVILVFFALGFLKPLVNLFGSTFTIGTYLFFIAKIIGNYNWYYKLALPILILILVDGIVMYFIYKRIQSKNKIIDVPVVTLLFVGFLCLGLDVFMDNFSNQVMQLSWSIIVLISVSGVVVLITGIYYGLPLKFKEELQKFFHI